MSQDLEYGLYIQTFPHPATTFTSVALDNGGQIPSKGKPLSLDFDLYLRNDNVFGTVFRIITDDNQNIDLMYSVGEGDNRFPILVIGDNVHPLYNELRRETWVPVSLTLDFNESNITVSYDGRTSNIKAPEIKEVQGIRVSFGLCPFEGFTQANVASVNVKDVRISRGKELIRHWKMAQHNEDVCCDELAHAPATCKNPNWIIDQYITWKKIYSHTYPIYPSVAFDPRMATFYLAMDSNDLYAYHATENVTDTIQVKKGVFAANYPNQLIYIPQQQCLLSYNLDENLYSTFNPAGQCWENIEPPTKEHDYWNNTLSYNPVDSSLVSFGGYGHYHYNNRLLVSYPYRNKEQKLIGLAQIHPRYTPSATVVNNTLYVFGGRGCPSGRQELSPRNYYDLYAVDLKNYDVSLLWNADSITAQEEFHPSENMIYDKENDCFYFMSFYCHRKSGTLMKIDTRAPHLEPMSLSIGLNSQSQYFYNNLYFSPTQKKLYTLVLQADVQGRSQVDIYELNYLPMSVSAFQQPPAKGKSHKAVSWIWIVAGVAVVAAAAGICIRKHRQTVQKTGETGTGVREQEQEKDKPITLVEEVEQPNFDHYDYSKSCVCFFGGFKVIDKTGQDITGLFTPTLKALLILLILHTGKDAKGITGHKLIQLLWYDKTEESAKNNRNVCVSKLRSILEKVGDVKILNQNNFWSVRFGEDVFCDYLEAMRLYKEHNNDDAELEKLLELLLHGMMLPNMEIDWIDKFKNEFSNQTIDLLCTLLKRPTLIDWVGLKIADTLFQHDYINEEALCVKCRILSKQGKKGLAKTVYDTFCKEYAASMGTEYKYSLMEVIQHTF